MLSGLIYLIKSLFKKPFKVGLISYYYPKGSIINNGVAIHTYYLANKLAEFGCGVHVFTKGERNLYKKSYPGKGKLVIHYVDTRFDSPIKNIVAKKRLHYFVFDNKIINEVTKENSEEKFDVIHTHGWLTAGAFISKYLGNLKWVHTFHALEKNRLKFMSKDEKKYYKIAKWIESTAKYADALIAVSKNLKKEVLMNYPVKKEKVFCIPNGVDLEVFKPGNNLDNEKIILYVGRFSLEKGIDLIPKIAKEVLEKNDQVKFLILASGPVLPSIRYVGDEFEMLTRKYPGRFLLQKEPIGREELARLYNRCLIYIQPSRYEAFGLAVLEAMACGKAVICSNRGGLPEVVSNAGIVLPLNAKKLTKNILRLLDDFRLRERYVRRAVKRAKGFSWNKIAGKTFALYKRLAKEKDLKFVRFK